MYALFIAGTVENKCVMLFSILLQLHKSCFWALSHSWMLVAKTIFYWHSNRNVCIPNSNTLAGLVSNVWFFFFFNMMGLTGPVIYCHCHCQRTECTDLLRHSKELLRVVVHHTNIVHCSEIINLSQIIHILFYLRFTLGYTITSRHAHAYTTHTHTHTHRGLHML